MRKKKEKENGNYDSLSSHISTNFKTNNCPQQQQQK